MAPTEPWPLSLAIHVSEVERRVHNQIRLDGESPIPPREQQNRFLCVSDGFSIYCLDLDQAGGDFIDYAETLPVVSTINLLEEHLPIASALFQLGSAGLMIGGKEIHKFEQPTDCLMLPAEIFNKYNFKGSSKATYQLFLAEGKLQISINYCFPELSCPKSWPIVEQIGNQLHVIESIPHFILHQTHDWIPSHEVLDLDDLAHGWKEVSHMGPVLPHCYCNMFMSDELVLGDKIFAIPQSCSIFNYYTLDCKTNDDNRCWEFHDNVLKDRQPHVSPRFHVSHLLNRGSFFCVGWFDKLVPGYAVIGFQNFPSEDEDDDGLVLTAMAVLVTPSGEAICHQSLPGLFDGIKPIDMHKATIFRVGDSTTSSTMFCVVLMGNYYSSTEPGSERVLYISTFCVEEEEANLEGGVFGSLEEVEERKFMQIVLKKRQMYKLGKNFGFGANPDSDICPTLRLTACFI